MRAVWASRVGVPGGHAGRACNPATFAQEMPLCPSLSSGPRTTLPPPAPYRPQALRPRWPARVAFRCQPELLDPAGSTSKLPGAGVVHTHRGLMSTGAIPVSCSMPVPKSIPLLVHTHRLCNLNKSKRVDPTASESASGCSHWHAPGAITRCAVPARLHELSGAGPAERGRPGQDSDGSASPLGRASRLGREAQALPLQARGERRRL